MSWYEWRGEELFLCLRVQARSRQDGVVDLYGDRLRVRVNAPPVDNKANAAVVALLAREFDVARTAVNLARGANSQNKLIVVRAPNKLPHWFSSLGGAPRC